MKSPLIIIVIIGIITVKTIIVIIIMTILSIRIFIKLGEGGMTIVESDADQIRSSRPGTGCGGSLSCLAGPLLSPTYRCGADATLRSHLLHIYMWSRCDLRVASAPHLYVGDNNGPARHESDPPQPVPGRDDLIWSASLSTIVIPPSPNLMKILIDNIVIIIITIIVFTVIIPIITIIIKGDFILILIPNISYIVIIVTIAKIFTMMMKCCFYDVFR